MTYNNTILKIRRGITDAAGTTLAQPIIYKSIKKNSKYMLCALMKLKVILIRISIKEQLN